MKINILLLCVLFLFLFSCESKKNSLEKGEVEIKEKIYDKEFLNSLIKKGINEGDTLAYDRAFSYVLENGGYIEFYYYALLMANKHNYGKAYYNLYILLTREGSKYNEIEIFSDDKGTQRQAIFYLLKSYELGQKNARSTLVTIFGENIPKSSDYLCENKI